MKIRILILLLTCTIFGFAQNQKERNYAHYKSLNLGIGYCYTYGKSDDKNYHLLDLGVNRTFYGGQHGGGVQYGMGTEVALNSHKFLLGPKVSGIIYFQFLAFGAELTTYTDFDKASVRLVPIIGLGNEKVRVTFNPHIILINDDFDPIVKGLVNLSVNLSLDRKKIEKNKSQ